MAYREPFKATPQDESFLEAFLFRSKPNESWRVICANAGLPATWFEKRQVESAGFVEWFLGEARRCMRVGALEVIRVLEGQFQALAKQATSECPQCNNPAVALEAAKTLDKVGRTILGWLEPPKIAIEYSGKVGLEILPSAGETRRRMFAYLVQEAKGLECYACGGPLVNWAAMEAGLGEGELVEVEAAVAEKLPVEKEAPKRLPLSGVAG